MSKSKFVKKVRKDGTVLWAKQRRKVARKPVEEPKLQDAGDGDQGDDGADVKPVEEPKKNARTKQK